IFGADLKKKYDPSSGQDAKIEQLVKIWDAGNWDSFYYSVFWELPPKTAIKQQKLESKVESKR
ncbi:MAG: hypothetical protein PUB45_03055, partial [Bacteroidales bacterium]|nr:hypothetical protein [Bacteroidales bacterium]